VAEDESTEAGDATLESETAPEEGEVDESVSTTGEDSSEEKNGGGIFDKELDKDEINCDGEF